MDNTEKVTRLNKKLIDSMPELASQIEKLKSEAEKHKLKSKKEVFINHKNTEITLLESGMVIIKFADVVEAEKFYTEIK